MALSEVFILFCSRPEKSVGPFDTGISRRPESSRLAPTLPSISSRPATLPAQHS